MRGSPRPIDATLHGVVDYTRRHAAADGVPEARRHRGHAVGHARSASRAPSTPATARSPTIRSGVVKAASRSRPTSRLDALGAIALAATPFVTGQYKKGRSQWVPHVALCLFELSSLLITDPTGRGDYHGDVEAVRQANSIDPGDKIRNGGLAVRRPSLA